MSLEIARAMKSAAAFRSPKRRERKRVLPSPSMVKKVAETPSAPSVILIEIKRSKLGSLKLDAANFRFESSRAGRRAIDLGLAGSYKVPSFWTKLLILEVRAKKK